MKFKKGDVVYTDTHAVHQRTQKSLSRLKGTIINADNEWDIHVELEDLSVTDNPVGFSEFELSHKPVKQYRNENS